MNAWSFILKHMCQSSINFISGFVIFLALPFASAGANNIQQGDSLLIHDGLQAFSKGTFDNALCSEGTVRLVSADGFSEGSYTSEVIAIPNPATCIIPSWNIFCGQNDGWFVEIQVRNAEGVLSPWFYLGSDGVSDFKRDKHMKCAWAKVAIDNIVLEKPAVAVQYRIFFRGIKGSPSLRLFALAFRHFQSSAYDMPDRKMIENTKPIIVQCRTQYAEDSDIASKICCPTSTSMQLEHLGIKIPTSEVAARLYNRENDIYGVWWAPPQFACQLGFKGWVRFFSSWRDVQEVLVKGQPVIASIAFGEGELTAAPIPSTSGHVVLITGFDDNGNVLVNDPASGKPEKGPVVYNIREFSRAWFGHGGVAIIICN